MMRPYRRVDLLLRRIVTPLGERQALLLTERFTPRFEHRIEFVPFFWLHNGLLCATILPEKDFSNSFSAPLFKQRGSLGCFVEEDIVALRRSVTFNFKIETVNDLYVPVYILLEEEIKPREISLHHPKVRTDVETDPLSALDLGRSRIVSMFSFFDIYLL